ncbi:MULTISPECIES: replication regulatory protein RepA [Serratia]|uniref:replication regulatory protein RepA n=1 Tax=Serratia TaxID=613 RepID=UPI001A1E48F2|nr:MULTISPECIES: replication regulatory protein RepA [Serratia]MCW7566379.1 replication regulatory protein RepA [Serratia marcescens]MCW7571383.1 replication regulatory protein RepA [Serratia marcescens]MCW7576384.1 replication regulatory protein RepA [Serratia marcescens]MCW7581384.1 replication regulatory protein RepA [Serratia marcescens]MCW7586382.1 replication regulatory protein RepA [Serratia marcescens]
MPQAVNPVTSSSKTKRSYRKGNPMSATERQLAAIARKRETHKEVNVFIKNPMKDQLLQLCEEEGLTQGQMIEKLIEIETGRRNSRM